MGTAASMRGYEGGRSGKPTVSMKYVAKNLADFLLHEWPSAFDITNELHRLQEAVDEYSFNRI
jgi:hypothetical protein